MKKKKLTQIELDKKRNLHYNLNSLELLEDLTGKSVNELNAKLEMKTIKVLVYAGLVHEDKELTLDEVGEMIGLEDIERVSIAIGKAFEGLN